YSTFDILSSIDDIMNDIYRDKNIMNIVQTRLQRPNNFDLIMPVELYRQVRYIVSMNTKVHDVGVDDTTFTYPNRCLDSNRGYPIFLVYTTQHLSIKMEITTSLWGLEECCTACICDFGLQLYMFGLQGNMLMHVRNHNIY
ncbi:hypothetical protein ACJX0J_023771, partial [Zea mays]